MRNGQSRVWFASLRYSLETALKIAYFVHDLTDPAVERRVLMLRAGGGDPVVIGLRRSAAAPSTVGGAPAIDLGRSYDGRLGHRIWATLSAALAVGRLRRLMAGVDVVMARTLEMLVVARFARAAGNPRARLVYECLDIHRLMLAETAPGAALRAIERWHMRRSDLLVVSSPAFLTAYFQSRQGLGASLALPALLVENKVLELAEPSPAAPRRRPPGRPWRIGWLGAIRCRKSLDVLAALAHRRPDLLEVRIWGRPAYSEFTDFAAQVAAARNVTFGGAYTAADLPRLYGEVDFAWAIDFMEEGRNSAWLLPNRIYEGPRFGALPIAMADVEIGRRLRQLRLGVVLQRIEDLEAVLETLTAAAYGDLKQALDATPRRQFVADRQDCHALVAMLGGDAAIPEPRQ